jgi:protein TonB
MNPPESSYPVEARRRGIETDCNLQLLVGTDGEVREVVSIQCGESGLGFEEVASEWALAEFRFEPAMRGGVAVEERVRWTFRFRREE